MTLETLRKAEARLVRNVAFLRVLAGGLAVWLLAMTLDMLWPGPLLLRGLFMTGLCGGTVLLFRQIRGRTPLREETLARTLESRRPELDNALIHAVQFRPQLTLLPEGSTLHRMQEEVRRGETALATLPAADILDRSALRRASLLLAALLGLTILIAAAFPRFYRYELSRFLLFWRDTPPFSLTDFYVTPPGATVPPGSSLEIQVRLGGQLPQRVELVSESAGDPPQSVPLLAADRTFYTARLENLTRDVWFTITADTGRSERYCIRIVAPNAAATQQEETVPPVVTIASPGRNVLVTPTMRVPLTLEAQAESGLQSVGLILRRNNGPEENRTFAVPSGVTARQTQTQLDLKTSGAKPGDVFLYKATAADSHQTAASESYWVWVVSDADYKRILEKQKRSRRQNSGRNASGGKTAQNSAAKFVPKPGSRPPANFGESGGGGGTALGLAQETAAPGATAKGTGKAGTAPRPDRLHNAATTQAETAPAQRPAPVLTGPAARAPAEYRALVRDYFKAISEKR